MASNTLQDSVNWAYPFISYAPLTVGTGNEPAITNANIVQQTILSAPFTWPWNRNAEMFTTTSGVQDYPETFTDFGYLETCSLTDSNNYIHELKDVYNTKTLSLSSATQRPHAIAVLTSTPGTGQTFRFMGVPDATYTATVTYQKLPVLFSSLSTTWGPIPDAFSDIYNPFFLSLALEMAGDPRSVYYRSRAVYALLAKAEGLTEMQRNMFLDQWLRTDNQAGWTSMKHQQGIQARAQ